MNLNATLFVAMLSIAGTYGGYRYGSRGPDLSLSTMEQNTLLRNEVVFRFLQIPAKDENEAGKKAREAKSEAQRQKAQFYMEALLKSHRCMGCGMRLMTDTALFQIVTPEMIAQQNGGK